MGVGEGIGRHLFLLGRTPGERGLSRTLGTQDGLEGGTDLKNPTRTRRTSITDGTCKLKLSEVPSPVGVPLFVPFIHWTPPLEILYVRGGGVRVGTGDPRSLPPRRPFRTNQSVVHFSEGTPNFDHEVGREVLILCLPSVYVLGPPTLSFSGRREVFSAWE